MNCPHCGAALPEGASFCQVCGRASSSGQQGATEERYGLAVTTLVLGLLAFLVFPFGIIALILGMIAFRRAGAVRERARNSFTLSVIALIVAIFGTLVGILVALMIGGMAAILFPVFSQAKAQARSATCLSNVQQLGLALRMYQSDWDEQYPLAANWTDSLREGYLSETQQGLLVCPEVIEAGYNYALNKAVAGKSLERVAGPDRLVVLFEADQPANFAGGPRDIAAPRHRGQNAFGFADGSAAMRAEQNWLTLEWNPKPARPTMPEPPPKPKPPVPLKPPVAPEAPPIPH